MTISGFSSRTFSIVWRKCSAPPSFKSSRATAVMTTCSQLHPPRRLGHARRFVPFERERLGRADRAKAARARAAVARDHESRRALLPAFPMVRALGAFADRVQLQFVQQPARARETVRRGQRDAQPFRQTRTRFLFSRCHFKSILTTDYADFQKTKIKSFPNPRNPQFHLAGFSKNPGNSSGPKSASTFPSTSSTGASSWPERRTISANAASSAITSSFS